MTSLHFADKLIGVHCTHGLNRSGFIVCRYMIEEMKMPPLEAIAGKHLSIYRPSRQEQFQFPKIPIHFCSI